MRKKNYCSVTENSFEALKSGWEIPKLSESWKKWWKGHVRRLVSKGENLKVDSGVFNGYMMR